jgi:hypothetical protein
MVNVDTAINYCNNNIFGRVINFPCFRRNNIRVGKDSVIVFVELYACCLRAIDQA